MAHEHLNFNLRWSKKQDDNDWQPILGAQEHSTFFMVYVRIDEMEQGTTKEGEEFWMYKFTFRLQNFRGAISMGIKGIPVVSQPDYENREDIGTSFSMDVMAFHHNDLESCEYITLKPIDKTKLLETLYTMYLPAELYDPKKPLKESKYLNPYRFQRDGEEYIELGYRPQGDRDFKPIDDNIGGEFGVCSPNLSRLI